MSDNVFYRMIDEKGHLESIFDDKEIAKAETKRRNYLAVDNESFTLDRFTLSTSDTDPVKYILACIYIKGNVRYNYPTLLCDPSGLRESDEEDEYEDNYYDIDIHYKESFEDERDALIEVFSEIPGGGDQCFTDEDFRDKILNKVTYDNTGARRFRPDRSRNVRVDMIAFCLGCRVFVESLLHKNESRFALDSRIIDLVRKDFKSRLARDEFRLKYIADHN